MWTLPEKLVTLGDAWAGASSLCPLALKYATTGLTFHHEASYLHAVMSLGWEGLEAFRWIVHSLWHSGWVNKFMGYVLIWISLQ